MTTTICTVSRFLSTLSLRRATIVVRKKDRQSSISIHALLAESDHNTENNYTDYYISIHALLAESDNLRVVDGSKSSIISIHALLAESDPPIMIREPATSRFLSTLSLRRATRGGVACYLDNLISIHALLAESDGDLVHLSALDGISIHALLAESDHIVKVQCVVHIAEFLSTLSLRRATVWDRRTNPRPRRFLSTLSLRRATTLGG